MRVYRRAQNGEVGSVTSANAAGIQRPGLAGPDGLPG